METATQTDVFISYSREDHAAASRFAQWCVERGWTVWWDDAIAPGRKWDQAIEQALAQVAESGANHGQILAAPVVNGLSRAKVLGVRKNGGACCLALSTDGHHAVAHEKQNRQVIDSSVTICVSPRTPGPARCLGSS